MINPEIYTNFTVYNYKGETSLSGYAISGNTFTFVADLSGAEFLVSTTNITWDLGDGTQSSELSPTHTYNWPGIYNISIVVYDSDGNAAYSTVRQQLSVYDVFENSLYVDAGVPNFYVPVGKYRPFLITRRNSWQSYSALSATNYTINLYVSGAIDPVVDLTLYNSDAWSHLRPRTFFFNKIQGQAATEYIPISSTTTTTDLVYVTLDSNKNYTICSATTPGAVFAGTSGTAIVYFTSYTPKHILVPFSNPAIIFCSLNSRKLQDEFTYATNYFEFNDPTIGYLNTNPVTLPAFLLYNPATNLSFSTNGIDTRADAILSSFNIPLISWQYTNIPFIVKLKDSEYFDTTTYPLLCSNVVNMTASGDLYNVKLSLVSNSTVVHGVSFYADFLPTLPANNGGYFKGYFNCPVSATNCVLSAIVSIADPSFVTESGSGVSAALAAVSGRSSIFNILPYTGQYNLTKQNENFDMTAFYDTLKLPDYLSDKHVLFNSFIGSIVGDSTSAPYTLGKTLYEKIANFCNNNNDLDTANIQALLSLCDEYGINTGEANVEFPPQLRRIADLVSIKKSKLFGNFFQNGNNFNLDTMALLPGVTNIGDKINIDTGTFSLSEALVAHEFFSNTYKVVKLPALSGYTLSSTFALSAYSPDWNLGLVLYDNITGADIGAYYEFYRYKESITPPIMDSVINWNDSTLTLSFYNSGYDTWSNPGGVMESVLNYEITKGLRLFTSAADITYNN
jgi:hypothetical protein